jgi:hypothetical protein
MAQLLHQYHGVLASILEDPRRTIGEVVSRVMPGLLGPSPLRPLPASDATPAERDDRSAAAEPATRLRRVWALLLGLAFAVSVAWAVLGGLSTGAAS